MKVKIVAVIGGILISGAMPLAAQEEEPPKLIQVVYEVFSLPEGEGAQSQRDSLTDRELYSRMVTGLEKGEVRQEKLLAIRSLTGQKATVDHASEFMFPTQFEPPKLPNQLGGYLEQSPDVENASLAESVAEAKKGAGWHEGNFPVTPATPSAFATLKLGDSLEIEATLGAEVGLVLLRFAATHLALKAPDSWGQGLSEANMPRFEEQKLQSSFSLKGGEPSMIGTISPSPATRKTNKEARVWFAFVTASVVEVKK